MSMAFAGISQNSKPDTLLPVPVIQLKKAIVLIEEGKVCKDEREIFRTLYFDLEKQVYIKDSIITVFKKNESDYKVVLNYYKQMNANNEEIINNLDANISIHQKFIKRQKFNRYLYAVAGVAFGFFVLK
jgi:hypothetical protein